MTVLASRLAFIVLFLIILIRAERIRGTVAMDVVVTPEGRATDVIVIKSPGDGLEEKAMEAVKSWKFRPAKDATGNPVAVRVLVEVTFQISK